MRSPNNKHLIQDRSVTQITFRAFWPSVLSTHSILFMAKRLIFVKPDGTPRTTKRGERANSGAPPVLVAFGD
jgi:hypothetical protein